LDKFPLEKKLNNNIVSICEFLTMMILPEIIERATTTFPMLENNMQNHVHRMLIYILSPITY